MQNKFKIGKATTDMMLKMDRAIRREEEIQNGLRINHHKVIASKKTYNRKPKYKVKY